MQAALIVFVSSFCCVFALGFQSLNVNQGRHFWASATSLIICTGTLYLFQQLPTAGFWPIAAYYIGCNLGINASMWAHPRLKAWADAGGFAAWSARRRLRKALIAKAHRLHGHRFADQFAPDAPPRRSPPAPAGWPGDTH
jgi:hypothetical protein